jgi:aerobic carbon-monoxide dehydrogenase medium subunit
VIPAAFDYVRPDSLDEAFAELADPEAKAIAGGHSLLPMMKLRLARPSRLVDLAGLDLSGVAVDGGTIRIGALTTYDELLSLRDAAPLPGALCDGAAEVGDVQVRNAGTVGGALAHGDPGSDFATAVIATGTTLLLRSPDGDREVAAEAFFLGPFTTLLAQQELLVELRVPVPAAGEGSAYVAFADPASGYPLAGAAVSAGSDGRCTVGLTGIAAQPLRATVVEEAIGASTDLGEALDTLGLMSLDGDPEHRRQLAIVAVERALDLARRRAES